ncbi:MAG: TlpA family protein disulfide reductase, partial [Tidjanibacter sp.]|nr:TlpA family protein disulfide reductase [Tidjanibacter sp.]
NKYYSMEAEEILAAVEGFSKELQKLPELVKVKGRAEGMLRTAVGKEFIEVKMPDAEGKEISLSEVVKANKVTLLDFWASWCRPCMGEVPYLLADYAEYHDKGFEIYGISLDNNKDAWVNTMNDKGMKWVNVSILGGWEAPAVKDYAVSSIPTNFLINSEGVIIAKNLRGEALGAKLAEIFAE